MSFPNGKPHAEPLEAFLAQFTGFELAPVRDESTEGDTTFMETCAAEDATLWSLYGRLPDGEALLVHDSDDAAEAAAHLARLHRERGAEIAVMDPARGIWRGTPEEIADQLGGQILDDVPAQGHPDARLDDFDTHPLDALRLPLCEEDAP